MFSQSLVLQATNLGDTGEELTLVVAERRLRLVTTTRSLTTTTIAVACAAAAAPDDSAAGNKSPAPGFALEHSGLLCCSAALVLCCLRSVLRAPGPLSADSDFSEPESAPPQWWKWEFWASAGGAKIFFMEMRCQYWLALFWILPEQGRAGIAHRAATSSACPS